MLRLNLLIQGSVDRNVHHFVRVYLLSHFDYRSTRMQCLFGILIFDFIFLCHFIYCTLITIAFPDDIQFG